MVTSGIKSIHNAHMPHYGGSTSFNGSLGATLVREGLLTIEELEDALREQSDTHTRLDDVLVKSGRITGEALMPWLAEEFGVTGVGLRDGLVDPAILSTFPRHDAESLNALPMFRVRDVLAVAMCDPQDLQTVDELERITRLQVRPILALRCDIQRMIPRVYDDQFGLGAVTGDMGEQSVELTPIDEFAIQDVGSLAEDSPVINLVNHVISQAVRQGASDIHMEPGHKTSTIRFRIDGQLREVLTPRRELHPSIVSRVKVMAKMDIAEHRRPQDGRMHVRVEGRDIDVRCSTLPTVLGEKAVLRILDRANVRFDLADLGLKNSQLKSVRRMLTRPHGLVLVTGPTGSGKTTTLYSALETIKSVRTNIVTVEDPVEYQLEMINQVQADEGSPMTFASALRSILRQDPDVIMVGEIRDHETAEVAIQAALTGHLVLSTLHTNDSAGAVTRLVDMGIAPFKIAAALVGVVAQRLVRNICPKCKTTYLPAADLLLQLGYAVDREFRRGKGCLECHGAGYRGRQGLYEVLSVEHELRELITREVSIETIRSWHREHGGSTLLQQGREMAEAGVTSLDEVARVAFVE